MSDATIGSLKSVFDDAEDDGILSAATKDLMCVSLNDNVLAGVAGTDIEDLDVTEVTLVSVLIDDSGSMWGRADAARKGQHDMLLAFIDSKQNDSILLGQWAMCLDDPYHSYVPVDQATKFDSNNYKADGSYTPLYDRWAEVLMANVAYAQQLRATGTPVRSVAVVITDGWDNGSRKFTANKCAQIAKDLIASEQFVLAFIGVGDDVDFRTVGLSMGIPDGAILLAGSSPSEMRRVFRMLSQSVIRASQTAIDPSAAQNTFFTP